VSKPWRIVTILLLLIALVLVVKYVVVDTRPLPQVQPTRDILQPTQPMRELAATPTPTP
jgi:hypothetical protein